MKRKSIGSLHGDLPTIADRICKTTLGSMVTVWISDRAEVYAESRRAADAEILPCMVGIYTMGVSPNDVVDDLLEARRERLGAGLLD